MFINSLSLSQSKRTFRELVINLYLLVKVLVYHYQLTHTLKKQNKNSSDIKNGILGYLPP